MTQKALSSKKNLSVIEKYLISSTSWQDGFREIKNLYDRPDFWIYVAHSASES